MDRVGERTLPMLLEERAAQYQDRPFLVHEDLNGLVTTKSFSQIRLDAQGYAAALQSEGLEQADQVLVVLRNTADFVGVWFGVNLAGAVFAPASIYLTARELAYVIGLLEPKFIITESPFLPAVHEAMAACGQAAKVISMDGGRDALAMAMLPQVAGCFSSPEIASSHLAEILFTSGTSSHPKGVMLTQANLVWCGVIGVANTGLSPSDRVFNNKPLFHANCQETVLSCLVGGATVIIGERYSASRYLDQLVRHQATVCSLSGMLCRTLLKQPLSDLDRAHSIRFAGYGINVSEAEITAFGERFGMRIRNGYGQTEAMVYITVESLDSPSTYPSIGRPAFNREVFVVDEDNCPLQAGAIGEIVVKGDRGRNVMQGYFKDEAATAVAFRGGLLHTKDLGSFDATGNLFFHGRLGDMIKRAGENISVQEVESVLIEHPDVEDVAVFGVDDAIRDQAVKAFVVLKSGASCRAEALQAFCRERLAYFKVPDFIAFLPSLPRNASGKVLKRELLDPPVSPREAHHAS